MMVQEIVLESEDSRAKVLEKVLWSAGRAGGDHGENANAENRQSEKSLPYPATDTDWDS